MKCIVINLARSGDRRKLVAEEFDSHGVAFKFSSAKDWLELSELDYENHVDRKSRLMNWNHSSVPGALACWISHQHVWRTCIDNEKLHMVAIFEDDVLLAKQFNLALRALESTRESFDIVFLNNGKPENTFKPLIEISDCFSLGLVKYGNIASCGYVMTRTAMQRLIDRFPRMTAPIDVIIHASWLTGLRTYTMNPSLVLHRTDHSSCIQVSSNKSRSAFQIAQDLLLISIPKRFKLSIPERLSYYLRTKDK